jgi:putative peptide zinc metalloprotease protein
MSVAERPRLQPGLRFSRHESDGAVSYVVKNPASLKYFRFGQVEAWLMQRMDGTRTLQQISDELRSEIGMNAPPQALGVLVRRLREMGLVERTLEERSALLVERVRQQRRARTQEKNSVLRMRFSAGDPDPLLETMVDRLPFFWTRNFILASFLVFLVYLVIVVTHWNDFVAGTAVLYSPTQMTIGIFLIIYGSFAVTAIIHEFGHGLTCKRHGGEVREMGAMLLYFMPAFYCNVSDAWTFEKKAHRLWVTLAGGWIQLWVAAAAAGLWLLTEPGTLINTIGLYTAVLSGGFSVLLNYNPLIPLDGYYALVDVLEMPNLRARSFAYVGAVVKRHVLRLDADVPAVTDRERRIFLTYGLLAAAYSTTILCLLSLMFGRFLGAKFGAWGWALFAFLLLMVTRRMRGSAGRVLRDFVVQKLPPGRRRRIAVGSAVAIVLFFAIASVVPWTIRAPGSAVIEPERRVWLRAPQDARLVDVLAREGDEVRAGDVVAVLRVADLDIAHAQLQAAVRELDARAGHARTIGNAAAARAAELAAEREQDRLDLLERQRDALLLRASADGVLVTPLLDERIGENVEAGDSLVQLWTGGTLHARVRVEQRLTAGMRVGSALRIRFPGDPSRTWRVQVERIEPAATDEGVIAFAALPADAAGRLRPGMQGRARIDAARTTIAGAIAHTWRRTIRGDLFL